MTPGVEVVSDGIVVVLGCEGSSDDEGDTDGSGAAVFGGVVVSALLGCGLIFIK